MEVFDLEGREFVELHNLLKLLGWVHSGGTAKALVGEGHVVVDGEVELRKRCKIRPGQVVEFQGMQARVQG